MQEQAYRYFLINKPRNMVSQFVSSHKKILLGDLDFDFPEGIHAIGRLDADSEGLLLLTTDKRVTRLLFLDTVPHERQYLVMVQHVVTEDTLQKLNEGVIIPIQNGAPYLAKPISVERIEQPLDLYPFAADEREKYPHTWLLITLTEGKFRQVRKMVLAVKHRCLRLVRLSISDTLLSDIAPGEVKEIEANEFFSKLKINLPLDVQNKASQ